MCTTGAKILRPGKEFILFKNRDFRRGQFDDRIQWTDSAFGVLGLETWDGDDPASDVFSGFSIGFNGHLACCDSNGKTVPGGANYDRLVQAVVENATTIEEAVAQVERLVHNDDFCWANMLVATPAGVAALEVRDRTVIVEHDPIVIARANHHLCGGSNEGFDDTVTTFVRYGLAAEGLQAVRSINDVFPLLRTHAPDRGYGICNHGLYETVYSYVVHWNEGATDFYVYQGHPCEGGKYTCIPVRFGATADLSAYPTRQPV